ncbi:MAG: PcfJ domain-containing protein [bacterium]|nr:PcfJ domain-containing protein [bacterium]
MAKRKARKRREQQREPGRKLKSHLRALGLSSTQEYQRWCRNRGLGSGTQKSDSQLRKEQSLAKRQWGDAALTRNRRNTRRPSNTIVKIYNRDLKKGDLGTDYFRKIRSVFSQFEDNGKSRRIFLELLLHVERNADLFGMEPAFPALGTKPGNTFIEGLGNLVRHHEDWLRPLADWDSDTHNPRRQFNHLARYLLAQYDVPAFMDAAWFQDITSETRQQNWFKHIGTGQNIRKANIPVRFTKMMAHLFLQAPDDFTIEKALRWAQIIGQDGSEGLSHAIMHSRIGTCFDHEDFWESVIKFFVNNPMLDPDQVGPLIDFMHTQKYETQQIARPGGIVEIAPPPQPNFSVKARSIDKLLRQMEEWHAHLIQEAYGEENGRTRKGKRVITRWEPSGIGEYRFMEGKNRSHSHTVWQVQELRSNRELVAEGKALNHCVSSYAKNCRKGNISVWSLRAVTDGLHEPVLTVAVDNMSRRVTQVRGKFNISVSGKRRNKKHNTLKQSYLRLIPRSQTILQKWMRKEGLRAYY